MNKKTIIALGLVALVVVGVLLWDNYRGSHQGYSTEPAPLNSSSNSNASIEKDLQANPDSGDEEYVGLDAQIQKL